MRGEGVNKAKNSVDVIYESSLSHLDLGGDQLPRQVVVLGVESHVVAEELLVLPLEPHHRVLPLDVY